MGSLPLTIFRLVVAIPLFAMSYPFMVLGFSMFGIVPAVGFFATCMGFVAFLATGEDQSREDMKEGVILIGFPFFAPIGYWYNFVVGESPNKQIGL